MKVRFADCTLDTGARRLVRKNRELHLSPKAFELLRVLVDHPGHALSKAELLDRVWPGVFVSDGSVAQAVAEIREAVGDDARKARIIRTVHGYGYAFGATVEGNGPARGADAAQGYCWIVWRKRALPLNQGEHIVGRDPGVSVWLDSPRVSRRHARVVVAGLSATIEDLGSKNGTSVRGKRISSPTSLESGDDIRIGPFTLSFRAASGQATTQSEMRSP